MSITGGFMSRSKLVLFVATAVTAALAWSLPAVAHPAAVKAVTVKVTAGKPSEFHFTLSTSSAAKPGTVTFQVTNKGTIPHDFKINGKATPLLSPGKTAK